MPQRRHDRKKIVEIDRLREEGYRCDALETIVRLKGPWHEENRRGWADEVVEIAPRISLRSSGRFRSRTTLQG